MKLRWTMPLLLSLGLIACDKKNEPAAATQPEPAETATVEGGEGKTDEAKPAEPAGTSSDRIKAAVAEVGKELAEGDKLAAAVDDVAALAKNADKGPLDAAAYEKLILDHATCEVKDGGNIDPKCPAVVALREAMSGGQALRNLAGGAAEIGKKHLGHASPAVRIKAAGLLSSVFGTSNESQDLVVEAAKKETDVGVLQALIGTVSNDGAKNAKVGELLLWAADHADANVRKKAIYALSSTWNRELAGGPEKLIALMESDADADVRATACKYAGKLGDAKFVPSYTRLTADGADAELRASCMEGLIQMWWSYPFHENANEDAYKLTLALLGKKPRTDKDPHWTLPGTFRSRNEDKFANWQAKNTWYKADELKAVLIDIIDDPNAKWMARTGAVDSLAVNGAKADLEALLAKYPEDAKGDAKHVRRKLTEAIAKAK